MPRLPLAALALLFAPLAASSQSLDLLLHPPAADDRAGQPGFGVMVAEVGDVDGDGHPDLAVGHSGYLGREIEVDGEPTYDYSAGGSVYVYSLRTGEVIRTVDFPRPDDGQGRFGRSIVRVGDLDGDGTDDLAVGAPDDGPVRNGIGNRTGRVHFVLTGAGEIRPAAALYDRADVHGLGWNLLAPGDLDGDGVPDVADLPFSGQGCASCSGAVFAFSGRTGGVLYEASAPRGVTYRPSGAAVADDDGDGVGDLVVVADRDGDAAGTRTEAAVVSGADGSYVRPVTVDYGGPGSIRPS